MEKIEQWEIGRLIPYARNPRKNDHAVDKIASAIREFGFKVPIIAKSNGDVVDGHLRLKAAQKLGMDTVPVVIADDLSDAQIKAFRLSVNKMAEIAEWDDELLHLELDELRDVDFDLDLTGFDAEDIDDALNCSNFKNLEVRENINTGDFLSLSVRFPAELVVDVVNIITSSVSHLSDVTVSVDE